jgi:ribonuclease HI
MDNMDIKMWYYAVKVGLIPGVYESWDEAKIQIDGYSGAVYKKFKDRTAASRFISKSNFKMKITLKSKALEPTSIPVTVDKNLYKMYKEYYRCFTTTPELYIYTDGSTQCNGASNAKGGYGVFFSYTHLSDIAETMVGKVTNNTCELQAIIEALNVLQHFPPSICAYIYYDSTYAAGVVTGHMRAHKNKKLVETAHRLLSACKCTVIFKHVKAHTNNTDIHSIGNKIADYLAGRGYS